MEAVFASIKTAEPATNILLNDLQTDHRMDEAWRMLACHSTEGPHFAAKLSRLLHHILARKMDADLLCKSKDFENKSELYFRKVLKSADCLSKFFAAIPLAGEPGYIGADGVILPNPQATQSLPQSALEFSMHVEECRRAMEWAEPFIAKLADAEAGALKRRRPASQKRIARTAFATMLCDDVNNAFGQPHYGFVAIVTDVLFPSGEPVSHDAIRMAWTGHRRNLNAAQPPEPFPMC